MENLPRLKRLFTIYRWLGFIAIWSFVGGVLTAFWGPWEIAWRIMGSAGFLTLLFGSFISSVSTEIKKLTPKEDAKETEKTK